MVRAVAVALALAAVPAAAQSKNIPGRGRISLAPSAAYVPDSPFRTNTQNALGASRREGTPLAYGGWASFGYGATESIEAAVDFVVATQTLNFDLNPTGSATFNRLTYGGGIGPRFIWRVDLGAMELQPRLSFGLMGTVIAVQAEGGANVSSSESFITSYFGGAGLDLIVSESYGVQLEYRFLYGRGRAPTEIGGSINGGGHFLMLGVSYYLLGEAPHQSGSL